ncbi:MAG: GreA/GreB family elongation factor [Candidatus Marinimicrobia bacterium]|nr:GreA/GreB family elongation factor [Candidatus Neomarinimicrobiota bacterium]
MSDRYFFKQEVYDELVEQLRSMKGPEKTQVQKDISAARAQGDLSENAEYHASRERLSMLMTKIQDLESKLANSEVYDPAERPKGKIFVGSNITIENIDSGVILEGEVVSMPLFKNDVVEISTKSPVGKAILGKSVGDKVTVKSERGTNRWLIKKVD